MGDRPNEQLHALTRTFGISGIIRRQFSNANQLNSRYRRAFVTHTPSSPTQAILELGCKNLAMLIRGAALITKQCPLLIFLTKGWIAVVVYDAILITRQTNAALSIQESSNSTTTKRPRCEDKE